jgi:hypothetical protein
MCFLLSFVFCLVVVVVVLNPQAVRPLCPTVSVEFMDTGSQRQHKLSDVLGWHFSETDGLVGTRARVQRGELFHGILRKLREIEGFPTGKGPGSELFADDILDQEAVSSATSFADIVGEMDDLLVRAEVEVNSDDGGLCMGALSGHRFDTDFDCDSDTGDFPRDGSRFSFSSSSESTRDGGVSPYSIGSGTTATTTGNSSSPGNNTNTDCSDGSKKQECEQVRVVVGGRGRGRGEGQKGKEKEGRNRGETSGGKLDITHSGIHQKQQKQQQPNKTGPACDPDSDSDSDVASLHNFSTSISIEGHTPSDRDTDGPFEEDLFDVNTVSTLGTAGEKQQRQPKQEGVQQSIASKDVDIFLCPPPSSSRNAPATAGCCVVS